MRTLFSIVCAFTFFVAVGWYVTYKSNPSKICSVHPDKKLASKYLYCWPGFDFPIDSFIDGHSPVERDRFIYQRTKQTLDQE
jgi:hypothetical protein